MSTRLWAIALNLKKMRAGFGSKDSKLEQRLVTRLDHFINDHSDAYAHGERAAEEAEMFEQAKRRIEKAVSDNSGADSQLETVGDVTAAYIFAKTAAIKPQPWADGSSIDEEELSFDDLYDLYEQFQQRLPEKALELILLIIEGRPLFGAGFEEYAGWYSYLTFDELKQLRADIDKVRRETRSLVESGALNKIDFDEYLVGVMEDLSSVLLRVERGGNDLFIYTA